MAKDLRFSVQLEHLRREADAIAGYVYAEMTIHHAASRSEKLLSRINSTPRFWNIVLASLQSSAYISLARAFDEDGRYNLTNLVASMEADLAVFSRPALAERKREGTSIDPPWLAQYVANAHELSSMDIARIKKRVEMHKQVYRRAIRPARDKYIAHRIFEDQSTIQGLFAKGLANDLWRLSTFLLRLHRVLSQAYDNGRKPLFSPMRRDIAQVFAATDGSNCAHDVTVRETKRLLEFLEVASPAKILDADDTPFLERGE